MKNISTKEFCDQFDACSKGRAFAENYATMRECYQALLNEEAGEESAEWAIWVFSREGATSEKNQRLFSVACARRVQHLMKDERSIRALDVAERYANGKATKTELKEAFAEAEMAALALMECGWTAACVAAASAARVGSERQAQLKILKTYGNIFEESEGEA